MRYHIQAALLQECSQRAAPVAERATAVAEKAATIAQQAISRNNTPLYRAFIENHLKWALYSLSCMNLVCIFPLCLYYSLHNIIIRPVGVRCY